MPMRLRKDILSGGEPADPTPTSGLSDAPPVGGTTPPGTGYPTSGPGDPNGLPGSGSFPTTGESGGVSNPGVPTSPPSSNSGGSGIAPTAPIESGSPGGNVFGPQSGPHGLSPAAITAIVLAVLLVLAIIAVAGRLLWRRRQERRGSYHIEPLPRSNQGYSSTSFTFDPQMAERLRGGMIDPYTGAASAETLSSQYRIEPFAVPPRRPPHARAYSGTGTRLLDDAAPFGASSMPGAAVGRGGKRPEPQPLPRGAMNLQIHGHSFSGLTPLGTPFGTPAADDDGAVFELPPTYASLAQPRPVRRWYQFWPPNSNPNPNHGGNSGSQWGSRSDSL